VICTKTVEMLDTRGILGSILVTAGVAGRADSWPSGHTIHIEVAAFMSLSVGRSGRFSAFALTDAPDLRSIDLREVGEGDEVGDDEAETVELRDVSAEPSEPSDEAEAPDEAETSEAEAEDSDQGDDAAALVEADEDDSDETEEPVAADAESDEAADDSDETEEPVAADAESDEAADDSEPDQADVGPVESETATTPDAAFTASFIAELRDMFVRGFGPPMQLTVPQNASPESPKETARKAKGISLAVPQKNGQGLGPSPQRPDEADPRSAALTIVLPSDADSNPVRFVPVAAAQQDRRGLLLVLGILVLLLGVIGALVLANRGGPDSQRISTVTSLPAPRPSPAPAIAATVPVTDSSIAPSTVAPTTAAPTTAAPTTAAPTSSVLTTAAPSSAAPATAAPSPTTARRPPTTARPTTARPTTAPTAPPTSAATLPPVTFSPPTWAPAVPVEPPPAEAADSTQGR